MSCTEQRFGRGERLKSITLQGKKKRSAVFYSNYPPKVTLQNWESILLKNSLKKEIKKIPYFIMLMFYFS